MTVNNDDIPDIVKTLANAASMHNRHADKIWITAVTITILVITSNISSEQNVRFFGFELSATRFYPVSAYLLGFLNIAYCSAHAHAYRVAEIFSEIIFGNSENTKNITTNFSKADAYYSLIASNFNRIYPITHVIPNRIKGVTYVILKSISDFIFMLSPTVGFLVAILRSDLNFGLTILTWTFFVVSTSASFILLSVSFRWVFKREHAIVRQKHLREGQ